MPTSPRKTSLLVIFLTVFIDLLGFAMVLPLLPIYADRFTTDEAGWLLGALMACFSVMQFIFAPLWGRLSDRIGRRPVLMVGLAGSVVFYTLFGFATAQGSLVLLFVSRIGAGVAGATVVTAQAYIADSTSLEDRPKGMALIGTAFGLGFTLGPLFGFLAVPGGQGDPGPWPGYAAAALSAVALLLAWFFLPESLTGESKAASRRTFQLRDLLAILSVLPVLAVIFVCVYTFAKFETTLSMLIKDREGVDSPFSFTWRQVCLTYAYIGFTLAVIQGGVVRRLAGRVSEGMLAGAGAMTEVIGFAMMVWAIHAQSVWLLLAALALVVAGFGFMSPSLNSLLSRRSDPAKQGGIMGLGQSVNAMARILGSFLGIPLLKYHNTIPFETAALLMALGLVLLILAVRGGKDYVKKGV